MHNWQSQTKLKFNEHDYLEIHYEDLASQNNKTMDKVFKFLNVNPTKIKTSLKKQNPEQIKDIVLNYTELKERLIAMELNSYLLEQE